MSNEVQFEEDNLISSLRDSVRTESGQEVGTLENLVIKTGIAKDKDQAYLVMIGIILFCIITSILVFFIFQPKRNTTFEKRFPSGSSALPQENI